MLCEQGAPPLDGPALQATAGLPPFSPSQWEPWRGQQPTKPQAAAWPWGPGLDAHSQKSEVWQQAAPPGGLLGETRWSSPEDACGILIPLGHLLPCAPGTWRLRFPHCEGGSAPGPRAVGGRTAGAQCPSHAWYWEVPPQWLPCSPLRGGARKVLPCSESTAFMGIT